MAEEVKNQENKPQDPLGAPISESPSGDIGAAQEEYAKRREAADKMVDQPEGEEAADKTNESQKASDDATNETNNEGDTSGDAHDERQSSDRADGERQSSENAADERESSGASDAQKIQAKINAVVKSRLARERKESDKVAAELAETKAKLEAIEKAEPEPDPKAETKTETKTKADEKPAADEVEYWPVDEPPEPQYYASNEEYEAACHAWINGPDPVVKPPMPASGDETPAAEVTKPVEQTQSQKKAEQTEQKAEQPEAPPRYRSVVDRQMENIKEALDAADEASETLTEDFFEMLKTGKIEVSEEMLSYMEATDDVWMIAQTFVEKPRESRRINGRPPSQQKKALESIIKGFGKTETKSNRTNANQSAPDITPLKGVNSGTEIDWEKMDQAAYTQRREDGMPFF